MPGGYRTKCATKIRVDDETHGVAVIGKTSGSRPWSQTSGKREKEEIVVSAGDRG